jgi:hypothetical protein
MTSMIAFFLIWLGLLNLSHAGTKSKKHGHAGVLEPYDGKHTSYSLTPEQNKKLQSGDPVVINQKEGRSGRGLVIQDVNAPPQICIDRIRDLPNYPKMCPTVKRVDMYDESKFQNGTILYGSEFKIGISLFSFNYYMRLKYDPKYYSFIWTLDYQYNSDFGEFYA